MRIGFGNAHFIADAHSGLPLEEMRRKWREGDYGKMRPDYATGWLKLARRIDP